MKIKVEPITKILRDGSLQMNVLNMPIKSQVCIVNNKRDILDEKIKVKKAVLYFSFSAVIVKLLFHSYDRIEKMLALHMIYNTCLSHQ